MWNCVCVYCEKGKCCTSEEESVADVQNSNGSGSEIVDRKKSGDLK